MVHPLDELRVDERVVIPVAAVGDDVGAAAGGPVLPKILDNIIH